MFACRANQKSCETLPEWLWVVMEWNGKAKEKEEGTIVEVLHVVPTDPPGAPKQKTYLV